MALHVARLGADRPLGTGDGGHNLVRISRYPTPITRLDGRLGPVSNRSLGDRNCDRAQPPHSDANGCLPSLPGVAAGRHVSVDATAGNRSPPECREPTNARGSRPGIVGAKRPRRTIATATPSRDLYV